MISWQIIYYLMLIQRQLIQHLAAVIRDNKSAPCKRKFRGTFVPTRARIAPKFILPRARACCPLLSHSSHILATSETPRPGSLFPLSILVGDTASKICVTVMSCSMTVDKHLTFSGKQSHFHASIPQWCARARARKIKYYFRTPTGNSMLLMRCHNYGDYVTVNGKLRYLIFPSFDFDVVRAKYTFPSYYLPRSVCLREYIYVFARLETTLVASRRCDTLIARAIIFPCCDGCFAYYNYFDTLTHLHGKQCFSISLHV